jgi:flagellar biosynthesis protein FlhF
MNIKRFTAPTSREALAKARAAFGEGTLILSNRPTANGVEVTATAEDALDALDQQHIAAAPVPAPVVPSRAVAPRKSLAERTQPAPSFKGPIEEDTEQLAMSTLSFQDYVRERMLRRRHDALQEQHGGAPLAQPEAEQPAPAVVKPARITKPAWAAAAEAQQPTAAAQQPAPARRSRPAADLLPEAASFAQPRTDQSIVNELHAMKALIEDRFNTLTWLGKARQDPIQSNLMLKMIRAGYSPTLSRGILERLPEELGAGDAVRWLMDVLERNLKTDAQAQPLYEQGGVFALVGSTGVGKTTTTAKIAAMCARQYGPNSVGLVTLDTYRVAGHEQLRNYGRMLGVVAHLAHDRAALQDMLNLLSNKKIVLIDTTGVAPRDPRKRDMLDLLDLPGVNRLMVLNASIHGDTMDDMLSAFKTSGAQQAILTKVDEAVKLGPAVDAIVRHQLVLRGVTNGQRVPEDWEAADARKLVQASMRAPAKSAYDPKAEDLNFIFSHSPELGLGRSDTHA